MIAPAMQRLLISIIIGLSAFTGSALAQPKVGIHDEWREAEQDLSATTPRGSNIRNEIAFLLPMLSHDGTLPEEFRPKNGNEFEMIVVLIPADELVIESAAAHGGQLYDPIYIYRKPHYRFFIHPSQAGFYSEIIKKYPRAPERWWATPSSSARSLFVQDERKKFPPFVAKVSLNLANGGMPTRLIDRKRLARGAVVSDIFMDLWNKSQGKLPLSGKSWFYMPEPLAISPKDLPDAGMIYRQIPDLGTDILIPWYALVSANRAKGRWFDRLFKASGYASRRDFAWKELILPLLEVYGVTSLDGAILSELHQQNTLIRISSRLKIIGPGVRDMDANRVDRVMREKVLKLPPLEISEETAKSLYSDTQRNVIDTYLESVRYHNIESIFKYVLDDDDLAWVLEQSDQFVLKKFNGLYSPLDPALLPRELPTKWNEVRAKAAGLPRPRYNRFLANRFERWLRRKLEYKKSAKERLGGICSLIWNLP